MDFHAINGCYLKVLGRMVDDDGLNAYKDITDPCALEEILRDSEEFLHNQRKKKISQQPTPIDNSCQKRTEFDIVVARYSEDPAFLDSFSQFPCRVFLYNKGGPVTHTFKSDVIIVNIDNVSFEEYAYLTHIIANYHNSRPTIFMQCALDHCPDILEFLTRHKDFGTFESMSQGLGDKDFAENTFDKIQSSFGMWYVPNAVDFKMVKETFDKRDNQDDADPVSFIEERYGVHVAFPYFAPGAQVYVRDFTKYDLNTFTRLKDDIEYLDSFGRHVSSRFQEILERYFWSSVWG